MTMSSSVVTQTVHSAVLLCLGVKAKIIFDTGFGFGSQCLGLDTQSLWLLAQ